MLWGRGRPGFKTCFLLVGFECLLSTGVWYLKERREPPHSPRIDRRTPGFSLLRSPSLLPKLLAWKVGRWESCTSGRRPSFGRIPRSLPSPSPLKALPKTEFPHLTCPCVLGEDGLALDVTGTQLVEKDIENLARGEVKYKKWSHEVPEGEILRGEGQ